MTDFAAAFKTIGERTARAALKQEDHEHMPENPKALRAIADGKLRLELIETALTHPVARVMAHGADKYGVRNWRTQPIYLRTYVAAMRRHVDAIADGQWLDPDSGEPHAAHVAACSQVILDARAHGTLNDDTAYAEGGVTGGVAANAEGGVKLTPEYERDQDADCCQDGGPIGAGVSRPQPMCPADQRPCPVRGGCTTPCQGV